MTLFGSFRKLGKEGYAAYELNSWTMMPGPSFIVPGFISLNSEKRDARGAWVSLFDVSDLDRKAIWLRRVRWQRDTLDVPDTWPPELRLKGICVREAISRALSLDLRTKHPVYPTGAEISHLLGYAAADNGSEVIQSTVECTYSAHEVPEGVTIVTSGIFSKNNPVDVGYNGANLLADSFATSFLVPWELALLLYPSIAVLERIHRDIPRLDQLGSEDGAR